MAKDLFEARYTTEGAKGVAQEGGSGRRAAVVKMVEGLGGKVETSTSHSAMSTHMSFSICPTT